MSPFSRPVARPTSSGSTTYHQEVKEEARRRIVGHPAINVDAPEDEIDDEYQKSG